MTGDRGAREALEAFAPPGGDRDPERLAGGYINPTWRAGPLVLQRLNRAVFPDPESVMRNVLAVAARIGAPRFVPTLGGEAWFTARDGSVWRAYEFVPGRTIRHAASPELAEAVAHAFGSFIMRVSDPPLPLHVTLPGFHDTRARLEQLAAAAERDDFGRAGGVRAELQRILAEADLAGTLRAQVDAGVIPLRVAHNDARIANVVFDPVMDSARCVIDLDTVMPGTPLHDFGDLVRSMVTGYSDEAPDPSAVRVREEYFAAIVRGFLRGTGGLLTSAETELLVTAARSIALEQAARFLADHLHGDAYYPVDRPTQNIARARSQLTLFDALSARSDALESIVAGMTDPTSGHRTQ